VENPNKNDPLHNFIILPANPENTDDPRLLKNINNLIIPDDKNTSFSEFF
jgi:hypothetical protein